MILKALTLENFKGIREPVRVEFAPLTLLFGPNNAGKSTIVQALMYAREVLERNNCDAGRTELGGTIVDLGGFENIVSGRDLKRVIRMRFELDLSDKGFPRYTEGWIEENELDYRIWDLAQGEEGFDVASAGKVTSRLNQVWVEIQISWDPNRGAQVSEYSVGHGALSYARISLSEEQEDEPRRALLSSLSYGTYPFGSTYHECAEVTSPLVSQARQFIKERLERDGLVDGFREGARVAMEGEVVDPADNRVPWETYNQLVEDAVTGRGEWGDSSVDPQTGEQNSFFRNREIWLAQVRIMTREGIPRLRKSTRVISWDVDSKPGSEHSQADEGLEQCDSNGEEGDEPSTAVGLSASGMAPRESLEDQGDPASLDPETESGSEESADPDEKLESWFLDLLRILIKWEYIPFGSTHPLRLSQLDTALPEWGRRIDFDPRIWEVDDSGGDWGTLLVFGQEYLRALLTTIIVGPGEQLKEALEQSVYLSPFREVPQRDFVAAHSPDSRRWCNGLAAWDRLILDGEPLAARVNQWLNGENRFRAGYWVEVKRFKELDVDSDLFHSLTSGTDSGDLKPMFEQVGRLPERRRLRIVGSSGDRFSPQDLGVGVSQVVPVIVAALHNRSGIVAIEEPESNIHPAFQVVLADLFITQAKENPDVLLLVETHSEHLMLRCLRRIRETGEGEVQNAAPNVGPEDISVHFVEPSEQGPVIHRIRIDDDGEFMDPWPRGFFPERMKEVYGDDL